MVSPRTFQMDFEAPPLPLLADAKARKLNSVNFDPPPYAGRGSEELAAGSGPEKAMDPSLETQTERKTRVSRAYSLHRYLARLARKDASSLIV